MGREKGIWNKLLSLSLIVTVLSINGCSPSHLKDESRVTINIESAAADSKAALPEENKISDVNVLIFDAYGRIVDQIHHSGGTAIQTSLIVGETYTFAAFANFGYKLTASTLDELEDLSYYLAYPDEYRDGLPMYSEITSHRICQEMVINLTMINLMSKISLRVDRNRLSEDVEMMVTGVRIRNCPKVTSIYRPNRIKTEDECFSVGFSHNAQECSSLNHMERTGISEEVSVYMFENMHGRFSENDIQEDGQKVLSEDDPRTGTCSYIELDLDYSSSLWHSGSTPLRYRFYLGEDLNSLDIERNCHYHITVIPEDDGLHGNGWRVDKSGLKYNGPVMLEQYPSDYIVGNIGDKIHIGCRLTPDNAPFSIGLDYLEDDRKNGIYDYEVDLDGHGVTLTLTGPGCGLIYMEAGEPINDTALFLIEVNTPKP